jgi:hypothetical protein
VSTVDDQREPAAASKVAPPKAPLAPASTRSQRGQETPPGHSHSGARGGSQPTLRSQMSYDVAANRRYQYDFMMWQVPALSLTAQAFLFTVALQAEATRAARLIASALALVVAAISMQLMAKHRHHERTEADRLKGFEEDQQLAGLHRPMQERGTQLRRWSPTALSSYHVWMVGIAVFGLAAVTIILISIVTPNWLGGGT